MFRSLRGLTIKESERRIRFAQGGMIEVRSTSRPDNLRGMGLDFVVLDEAAHMEPAVWSQVVRPMLLDHRGGALFLSSPLGHNWFWELFKVGLDPEEPDWQSFQFQSQDNPFVNPSELVHIQQDTPDRIFREEYLAHFIADAGQVFRGVAQVATAPTHAQPIAGHRYIMGVDWGREHDFTCIVVVDADTGQMVALDRFNQVGWSLQRERLKALADTWRPVTIWAEHNSIGSVNIEALQAEGLPVRPFQTTVRSKGPLIEGLALAIEQGRIRLLPDEVLSNELVSYRMERMAGGYRYGAPAGRHDDTVIATALAWHGVRMGGLKVDFA